MATKRLYKFRLWCLVEATYLETWAEVEPNACPHNPAHGLDHARTLILESMDGGVEQVDVIEEAAESDTGGYFQCEGYEIDVPAGADPPAKDLTWPVPVSVLAAKFAATGFIGDELEVQVAPNTIVGTITAEAAAGAKIMSVWQTVVDNAKRGFWVKIGAEDLGRITKVDKTAMTIETETALAAIAPAGSLVKVTVKMIPRLRINTPSYPWEIGFSKIGGSYIKAGTTIRLLYKNIEGSAKKFPFEIELLY